MELQRSGNTVEPRKFSSLNYFRSSYDRIGHQIGLLDSRLATDGVKSTEGRAWARSLIETPPAEDSVGRPGTLPVSGQYWVRESSTAIRIILLA